ncbi:hypothetical protein B0A49_07247 [Cryomyces minteri]|uniref:Thiamine-binding protein domain-containing protein n=1 Tax=Cryomyces minteri TaxID=331657 RepID=A0A4U0WWX3_9PEZI|nr:hypothetical protein B0A49_07247 [Cryomyces minteri]
MSSNDLTSLPTPPACLADVCIVPIGTPTASVSKEVAEVQRLLKKSGLHYTMHSAGTTIEGSWDECMRVIGQAHTMLHRNGVTPEDKVNAVNALLSKDEEGKSES